MRILQLVPRLPYPLTDGGKVGIFNITKHLALRGHKITMLTFDQENPKDVGPLQDLCELIPIQASTKDSILKGFLNLFSNVPYKISKYRSSKYRETLLELLKSRSYDVVHVDHLHMAHYGIMCKRHANLPIVLREHNVESTIVERFVQTITTPIVRTYLDAQLKRIRRFEAEQTEWFDMCCMITEEDRKRLQTLNPSAKTCVIPGGVDSSYFSKLPPDSKIPHSICFFGTYAWIANRDGILWFIKEVFPKILEKIPDATLFLVGKEFPSNALDFQCRNIIVHGYAANLKEELSQYELTIAPIRIGGGIRLKILESFAMHLPVVSTSVGCEGIEAQDSVHLLKGDTPEEFSQQVVRLLTNRDLQKQIAANAYSLANQRYRWEHVAEQLEIVYKDVLAKK